MLAYLYFGGQGVLEDYVAAYAWAIIAVANDDIRDKEDEWEEFREKMTPEQIAKAQELSKDMVKKNPKLLTGLKLPSFNETLPENPTEMIQKNLKLLHAPEERK
jgi:hypothetical protein